jgi:hypothetical protein
MRIEHKSGLNIEKVLPLDTNRDRQATETVPELQKRENSITDSQFSLETVLE